MNIFIDLHIDLANDYFCAVIKTPFIYLAPLEDCTEIDFRNVFAKHFQGVDAAISPFVSLMHHVIAIKKTCLVQ